MSGKTYAQRVNEHAALNLPAEDDIIEYRRVWQKHVIDNINNVIEQSRKAPAYDRKDFFIVMRVGMEHIGQIPKTMVYSRFTCEAPAFKQSQWRYNWKTQTLDYLWCLPDKLIYYDMLRRAPELLKDPETAEQTKQCIMFASGELEAWARAQDKGKPGYIIKVEH